MNTPRSFLDAIGLAVACPGTQLETHCIMCGYGNGIMANFCADCGEQLRGPRKPLPQPLPSAMELGEKHEIHLRMDDRLLTSPDAMLLSCSLELLADTELYRTVGGKTFAAARRDETKLNIAFLNTHDLCLQKEPQNVETPGHTETTATPTDAAHADGSDAATPDPLP